MTLFINCTCLPLSIIKEENKMIKYLQYFVAYLSLIILWIFFILAFGSIFNLFGVDTNPGLVIIGIFFALIYHKYKPMKFKDLLAKIGISI